MITPYPEVPLAEVLTQDLEYIAAIEPRLYKKISVKWWGKGAVPDAPTDGSTIRMARHQLAKPGQVIVSEIWAKHGSIGIVPHECEGALITSHFYLFDIDACHLLPEYMSWLVAADYLTPQMAELARGTTGYAAIRPHQFLSATIPVPPLDEQRRIVARIAAIAARVEEARGLRRAAMEEADTLIVQASRQAFDHVKASETRLADILSEDTLNGIGTRPSDLPPGMPILRISAGTSRSDGIVDEGDYKYLEADEQMVKKHRLKPDDLLACRFNGNLNYVGRFSIYSGSSGLIQLFPDKLIRFRVDRSKAEPRYVLLAMNSPMGRERVEKHCATTAGNIGISAGNLKSIHIPVPRLEEQRRIIAHLDDLQARVDALKRLQAESAAELEALLPSVLDRAFRGEL